MKWYDLFYFSKGERRALLLLLFLISGAWLTLVFTRRENPATTAPIQAESVRQIPATRPDSTTRQPRKPKANKAERRQFAQPWIGPKKQTGQYPKKYPAGTVVELNSADTAILRRVPGIGPVFARRIVGFRRLLGGFCHIEQLREVYGIDEEKYRSLSPWFRIDTARIERMAINRLPEDSLRRHPYISYGQAKVIIRLRNRNGKIGGWNELEMLDEFAPDDRLRLEAYFSFE